MAFFAILLASILVACGSTSSPSSTTSSASSTNTNKSSGSSTSTGSSSTPQAAGTTCSSTSGTTYNLDTQQSSASYKVQEQFLNRDLPNDAIGTTKDVKGNFVVKLGTAPQMLKMNITANLQVLTSDQDRRDNSIRTQWLDSNDYPNAIFTIIQPQNLPADYQGKTVTFNLTGNMTIHNTTRQETFKVTGKLDGNTISGT